MTANQDRATARQSGMTRKDFLRGVGAAGAGGLVVGGVIAVALATVAIWWCWPSQQRKRQVDALIAGAISGDTKAVSLLAPPG